MSMQDNRQDPETIQALATLIEDYNAAAKVHVPNWKGGINRNVAAELVRMGWRKTLPK